MRMLGKKKEECAKLLEMVEKSDPLQGVQMTGIKLYKTMGHSPR